MKRSKRKPEESGDVEPSAGEARLAAMNLLARREHSTLELQHKLSARNFPSELIDDVLGTLAQEGLQSDSRFAEMFVRTRRDRGYGPVRIRAELRERGVADELVAAHLDDCGADWLGLAAQAREKRFGKALPSEWKERARQARFLQYRGFSAEDIRELLSGHESS